MRQLTTVVLILGLALFLSAAPRAQNADAAAAIRTVIQSQIEAFRQDDAATAYSYAAPQIQRQFQTPDRFITMVKAGYMAVYRPQSYVFGMLGRQDGRTIQAVRVIGPDGTPVIAHYVMEEQPDGEWKIAGVFLTRSPDQSA